MNGLIKVKEVSKMYNITARTLRYYEDVGLISSIRSENYAYRLYDETTVKRIEQILILRKLNISIRNIQRIFNSSGSDVVLNVLEKKVQDIDDEVALLHELRDVVIEFIQQIEVFDFSNDSAVKILYKKAKDIETHLTNIDYIGKPSNVQRLLEVTEKLDKKIPDVMIVRIPNFRAVTSGLVSWEEVFGVFQQWQSMHNHLFKPVIFDSPDFLTGEDDKVEWFWGIKDEVTDVDVKPYYITEFPGGLYAAAVSLDGDGESHDKVRSKTEKWLESTNFVIDHDRRLMGHMIYVDDEIKEGLGYHQMNLYAPIKLKKKIGWNNR